MPVKLSYMLEQGILSIPFRELTETELVDFRSSLEAVEPGFAFAKPDTPLYTSPLTIYYLEYLGQKFWIYDSQGFICSTSSVEALVILLMAEARINPDSARPAYHRGARDFLFPGTAEAGESRIHGMQELARRRRAEMRAKSGQIIDHTGGSDFTPKESYEGEGSALLRTLGLDEDGSDHES